MPTASRALLVILPLVWCRQGSVTLVPCSPHRPRAQSGAKSDDGLPQRLHGADLYSIRLETTQGTLET